MTLDEHMSEIAKTVARRYRYRCWWAEEDDLVQQAWIGLLEVRNWSTAAKESPEAFGSIAYHAAWAQVGRYLYRQSSPLSASDHNVRALSALRKVPLEAAARVHDPAMTPEQLFGALEALEHINVAVRPAIAKRIKELYTRTGWPAEYLDANLKIYLDGLTPGEAAKQTGVDVRGVYKTTAEMRGMFRKDRTMRGFATQLVEGRS